MIAQQSIDFIVYGAGLYFALYDDRHGDLHPNRDWLGIGIVILGASIVVALGHQIRSLILHDYFDWSAFLIDILKGCAMGTGHCILLFSWAVSFMMWKRKTVELPDGVKWWNHFSKTAIPDKWPWWQKLHWSIRRMIWAGIASPFYFLYYFL